MNRTDELPPFETRLLAELTSVVEARQRAAEAPAVRRVTATERPRVRLAAAGLAVAAAIALVAGPALRGGGNPAFAIRELADGVIEVTYQGDLRDGRALEAELRSFGVDVAIVAVPASPSAVGRVAAIEQPDGVAQPGFAWGADGAAVAFTIDPAVFRDTIILHLAVEALAGEPYQMSEEVFEPGEVLGGLHCALGEPIRAAALAPYLDELGQGARWLVASPVAGEPDSLRTGEVTEVPDGEVLWGYSTDASTVEFTVRPDGVGLSEHWPPRLSDIPCSTLDASGWD
jgi:hypothetical protein